MSRNRIVQLEYDNAGDRKGSNYSNRWQRKLNYDLLIYYDILIYYPHFLKRAASATDLCGYNNSCNN